MARELGITLADSGTRCSGTKGAASIFVAALLKGRPSIPMLGGWTPNLRQATLPGVSNSRGGAPDGRGTLNLNINVPTAMQPTKVSIGRFPVNAATYLAGSGATLHIPAGPGGADRPLTLSFSSSQFTAHLDSAFPYNPIGSLSHLLTDMGGLGGYKPCP